MLCVCMSICKFRSRSSLDENGKKERKNSKFKNVINENVFNAKSLFFVQTYLNFSLVQHEHANSLHNNLSNLFC